MCHAADPGRPTETHRAGGGRSEDTGAGAGVDDALHAPRGEAGGEHTFGSGDDGVVLPLRVVVAAVGRIAL